MAYMPCCNQVRRRASGLGDLGFDPTSLISSVLPKLIPSPSSGGGSSMPASSAPITVSPTLSTQVSPQISPVFQQQFQPSGSAMSAGTAQYIPTSQGAPGSTPGASPFPDAPSAGGAMPVGFPGSVLPGYSTEQGGTIFGIRTGYVVLGAAALVAAFLIIKKRRGNSGLKTYRSKSEALAVR